MHPAVDLGRDHQLVAPAEVLQRPTDDLLAAAGRVHVRGVEEVDPRFERLTDQRPAGLLVERPRMGAAFRFAVAHAAQDEAGHLESRRCPAARNPSAPHLSFGRGAAQQPSQARGYSFLLQIGSLCMDGRRQAWAISCIGEPAAEIEDAFTDEVPSAFGRQVLRLTRAELGRPWDECVPSPGPFGKREIAIAGRRVQGIVPAPEPTTPSGRVIDGRSVRGGPASRRSFRSTSADMGTSTCRPTRLPGGPPSGDRVRGSGAGRRSDQPPGDPGPGIAPLRTGWIPRRKR